MKTYDYYSTEQLIRLGWKHQYNIGRLEVWKDDVYYIHVDMITRKVERYYYLRGNGEEFDL